MPRIAEKLSFLTGAMVETGHRIGAEPANSYFMRRLGLTKLPEAAKKLQFPRRTWYSIRN